MNWKTEETVITVTDDAGTKVAEVLFPKIGEAEYTITHTWVDASLRGQGMAGRLVEAAVDQIRKNGGTPRASCSYAVRWFAEHLEK